MIAVDTKNVYEQIIENKPRANKMNLYFSSHFFPLLILSPHLPIKFNSHVKMKFHILQDIFLGGMCEFHTISLKLTETQFYSHFSLRIFVVVCKRI